MGVSPGGPFAASNEVSYPPIADKRNKSSTCILRPSTSTSVVQSCLRALFMALLQRGLRKETPAGDDGDGVSHSDQYTVATSTSGGQESEVFPKLYRQSLVVDFLVRKE